MTRRYVMRLRRPRFRAARTPVVTPRGSTLRLVMLGILSVSLVVAVWLGTTQTVAGQQIADMILYGRVVADPAVLGAATETLTTVSLAFAGTAALGLLLLALVRGGLGLAIAVIALFGGANLTAQALKVLLERPNLLGDAAYAAGNSFPSGHVTIAASLGLACVLVVPRRVRTPMAVVAATLIAAVGVSTMIAGWHRLADVEGAILISLAWAALVTAILVQAQGWMPRQTWGRGRGGMAMTLAGVLGTVVAMAGVAGIVVVGIEPTPLAQLFATQEVAPRTFVAALAIAAGTALTGCAGYVWAMRGVAFEPPG